MTDVSLKQLASTFVPFGLALFVAVMAGEVTRTLDYSRAVYTMWVSIVFAVSAACMLALPNRTEAWSGYRLMLWTLGFVAYVGHAYYSSVVSFNVDLRAIHADQGIAIAVVRILVGGIWAAGLVLEWSSLSRRTWARAYGVAAHVAVLSVFFASAIILRSGVDQTFVIALAIIVLAFVAARLASWRGSDAGAGRGQFSTTGG